MCHVNSLDLYSVGNYEILGTGKLTIIREFIESERRNVKVEKNAEQRRLKRVVCLHIFSTVCLLHSDADLYLATPVSHFCPLFLLVH